MKFLCVACDEPMTLEKTESPQQATITALFECPECFTQVAMLTNPSETQMIRSLGVKIGPAPGAAANGESVAAASNGTPDREPATSETESKCPFASMLTKVEAEPVADGTPSWTQEALARLDNIPEFVRPMAKQGIEQFAQAEGQSVIDVGLLDQARGKFGM